MSSKNRSTKSCPVCSSPVPWKAYYSPAQYRRRKTCSRRCGAINKRNLVDRFWDKVEATDGCWIWGGSLYNTGYGEIRNKTTRLLAHRVSWEIHFGKIPDGLCVLHRCDNPPCVNPKHLFLGTRGDNIRDCIQKGRNRPVTGKENANSKLTLDQAQEIKRELKHGVSHRALGRRFGVGHGAIGLIARGKTWRDA